MGSRDRSCVRVLCLCLSLFGTPLGCSRVEPQDRPSGADRAASPTKVPASTQQGLAMREYEASENGLGLQAPNRAHDLRIYFTTSGIRVHDRTPEAAELLALSLTAIGRGDALMPVPPGELVSQGARVEIRRPGLVEWYENSPAGLEQGFTLAAPVSSVEDRNTRPSRCTAATRRRLNSSGSPRSGM